MRKHVTVTIRIDWPLCQARGLCAEILPEVIHVDEWGYPVVTGPVPPEQREMAAEAARVCPHRALRVLKS